MPSNSQFQIDIGANLITDNVPKQIEALNAKIVNTTNTKLKIPVGIDENGIKQFDTVIKKVNTYKDAYGNLYKQTLKFKELQDELGNGTGNFELISDPNDSLTKVSAKIRELTTETHKWTNSKGEINEWVTTVDSAGQQVSKRTKQYVDDSKNLVKETSNWTRNSKGQWEQIGDTIKTVTDNYKQSTNIISTETHKFVDSKGAIQTWVTTIDDAGKRVSTRTKEIVDGMGNVTQVTQRFEAEAGKPFRKVGDDIVKVSEILQETTTTTSTTVGQITDTINGVERTFEGTITTIKKVSSNGEELTTVISKYNDDLGRTIEKTEQFNKAGDHVATTMRKISEATPAKNTETKTWIDKNGVKTVEQYLNGVLQLTTITKEYVNQNKELVTETTQLEGATRKLISTHTERSRNIQKETEELNKEIDATFRLRNALISTTTTTSKGKTTQFGDKSGREYDALITKIERVDAANKKVIETTWEFTNAQGQLVRQTRITDAEGKKLAEDTIQISDAQEKVVNSTNKYNTSTKQAAKETRTFGQALTDALKRLARYYIASLPIQAVRKAISEAINTVKEFDNALIEFRKVSDLAGESLSNYVDKLAEMGELTGSTMQAMVEASTEFRKSGFSDEDSAKLASVAEMYRNIADEEISAGESASFIIAQMKAFNIEADQAEHIIDSVNEVANNFSVSSADLAKNLGNMSAIMAINNVSMEEQIGMLTGVTEITRNASSASRGLVMVSSRLTQVLDDTSSTGKKLTKIYKNLGIELKDENGQLRSHYDILGDLANKWNTLSENEQKYIALTSAGARQQQNFVALMSNWNQVANATATAYNSINSAQKENEKVMESITKKTEILKSEFQQLVIGKGGLQEFAKSLLDIGIALLKFANSDVGRAIIQITAITSSILLAAKGLKVLSATLIKNAAAIVANNLATKGWTEEQIKAKVATIGLAEAIKINTAALLKNALAFISNPVTLFALAVAGTIATVIKLNEVLDETKERIEQANKYIAELTQEINALRYAQIKESELSRAEKDRLEYLEKRLELEKKLKTVKTEATEARAENLEFDWLNPYGQLGGVITAAWGSDEANIDRANLYGGKGATQEQPNAWFEVDETTLGKYAQLRQEIALWNDYTDEGTQLLEEKQNESQTYLTSLEAERDNLGQLRDTYEKNAERYEFLSDKKRIGIELSQSEEKELNQLKDTQKELNDRDEERLSVLENTIGVYHKSIETIETYQEAIEEYGEESEEADSILKDFAKDLGISEEALVDNANAMGVSIDKYYEYAMAIKESDSAIDNFQSSVETLAGAVDEYNDSQYLSIDTVQALLSLQPEYLSMLSEENGQLVLNEQAIVDKCNALIEERKQTALQIAYDKLSAIERGENQAAAESQSGAIASNASELDNETDSLNKNTIEQYANRIARNDKSKGTAASEVVRELEKEFSILEKLGNSYSQIKSSSKKAGKAGAGAAKEAKDAQKELNKELEDTKSKYDKVITFITGRIDKHIKAIQKEKDEEIKAIEAIIKAREKEKDRALDNIEKQINALEKEKEAREKYWDDQIDALKKANDARKDALELQEKLDALERAKNTKVKVYKEGQGFVYDVDQTAVAEAQKALDEYLSEKAYEDELARLEALKDAEIDNYNKRLDALNEYKDRVQESYEKQIEALNEHREALEEQYDAQIEYFNNFKDQFEEMVKAYEDKQTELLASQLTGINFENDNWMTRLDNLAKFVNEYNRLQEQLNTGSKDNSNTAKLNGGNSSGLNSTETDKNGKVNAVMTVKPREVTPQEREYMARVRHVEKKYASGVSSIANDEIALVGENPNQELVIGSKINNGQLMSLDKGTGVVNANSSRTLAGMLNQVGQFGSSGFGSGNGTLNSNINNDTLTINGVTIQGANIKDPETFVNGLLNLKAEALQRAYRHR